MWIRTYPVTFLHDVTEQRHDLRWHQLTYAVGTATSPSRGHLEVITDDARRFVPADRAMVCGVAVTKEQVARWPIDPTDAMSALITEARPLGWSTYLSSFVARQL